MKCPVCGNPVPRDASVCPYCESPLSREAPRPSPPVKTINVKEGNQPGEVVADRLQTMLANAKAAGTKVVIVIHGYGSTGAGGSIREAVRNRLVQMQAERRIHSAVPGEAFGPSNDEAIRIASTHRTLLAPHVFGAGNEGITLVVL